VAINETETVLGELTIPADWSQTKTLLDWAQRLDGDGRVWAVEAAGGLGYLLSQQLIARGEHVVDVPPVLASRVRLLGSGRSDKNDPNDARSVAIAALRQPGLARVRPEDHTQVLRMLAKRHLELTALRTQAACRLHAVILQLRPGGIGQRLSAARYPGGRCPSWGAFGAREIPQTPSGGERGRAWGATTDEVVKDPVRHRKA